MTITIVRAERPTRTSYPRRGPRASVRVYKMNRAAHAANLARSLSWSAAKTYVAHGRTPRGEPKVLCVQTGEKFRRVDHAAKRFGISVSAVQKSMNHGHKLGVVGLTFKRLVPSKRMKNREAAA